MNDDGIDESIGVANDEGLGVEYDITFQTDREGLCFVMMMIEVRFRYRGK